MTASSENLSANSDNTKQAKRKIFDKSLFIIVLLITILLAGAAGAGFYFGREYGRNEGTKEAVSKVTDLLNPVNALSNNASFPYTTVGKVVKVEAKSITVKQPNGEEKTVLVSEKTKVSQGSEVKSLSDVKKDANITIFSSGKGADQVANRVIIR